MGKKTNIQTTNELSASGANSIETSQQGSLQARKAKAMILLNEYMRYFGAVSGLHRQIVDCQRDVVCRLGRSAWRTLTQEELDKAFDSHIVHDYIQDGSMLQTTFEDNNSEQTSSQSQNDGNCRERRDSVQSMTDLNGNDGFAGPFSWRTRSLQDLTFPKTPEMEVKVKKQGSASECKGNDDGSSTDEDEVRRLMTVEELRVELARSYQEQQSARKKMQEMKSPKSKKLPEKITKSAVEARLGTTRTSSVGSSKRQESNGMPTSPADLTPISSLRPVNQERVKLDRRQILENGTCSNEDQSSQSWKTPQPTMSRKSNTAESRCNDSSVQRVPVQTRDDKSHLLRKRTESNGSYVGKSPRHESFTSKIEQSPHRVTGNGQNGVSPSHIELSNSYDSKSYRSDSSSNHPTSPDRVSVKDMSEDLSRYFSSKNQKNANGSDNSDMLTDLFKNW